MIGDRVRHERQMAGMSQAELAKHAGVAASTIHAIENKDFDSRLSIAIKLKNAFGYYSVEQLTKPLREDEKQALIDLNQHRNKLKEQEKKRRISEWKKRQRQLAKLTLGYMPYKGK